MQGYESTVSLSKGYDRLVFMHCERLCRHGLSRGCMILSAQFFHICHQIARAFSKEKRTSRVLGGMYVEYQNSK